MGGLGRPFSLLVASGVGTVGSRSRAPGVARPKTTLLITPRNVCPKFPLCSRSLEVQRRSRGSATLPRHACQLHQPPAHQHV